MRNQRQHARSGKGDTDVAVVVTPLAIAQAKHLVAAIRFAENADDLVVALSDFQFFIVRQVEPAAADKRQQCQNDDRRSKWSLHFLLLKFVHCQVREPLLQILNGNCQE